MRCFGAGRKCVQAFSQQKGSGNAVQPVADASMTPDEPDTRERAVSALDLNGPWQTVTELDLRAWIRGAIGTAWSVEYSDACRELHANGCDNTAAMRLMEQEDLVNAGFKHLHAKQVCARLARDTADTVQIGTHHTFGVLGEPPAIGEWSQLATRRTTNGADNGAILKNMDDGLRVDRRPVDDLYSIGLNNEEDELEQYRKKIFPSAHETQRIHSSTSEYKPYTPLRDRASHLAWKHTNATQS